MTKLFPDDIANLRLLGFLVTNKEGQTFVESENFIIECDFDRWYLYETKKERYEYRDEFSTVYEAIDYAKDLI